MKFYTLLVGTVAVCVLTLVGCRAASPLEKSIKERFQAHKYKVHLPEDQMHRDMSVQQLMDGIVNEGCGGWRYYAINWFMWKTRDKPELRRELTERIMARLREVSKTRSLHDQATLADCLGPLGARDEIIQLTNECETFGCCYKPVRALLKCGDIDDLPLLIRCARKEREGSGGMMNEILSDLTGHTIPLKNPYTGAYYTDADAWQAWYDSQVASGAIK